VGPSGQADMRAGSPRPLLTPRPQSETPNPRAGLTHSERAVYSESHLWTLQLVLQPDDQVRGPPIGLWGPGLGQSFWVLQTLTTVGHSSRSCILGLIRQSPCHREGPDPSSAPTPPTMDPTKELEPSLTTPLLRIKGYHILNGTSRWGCRFT
jgi:hypothetical protein